MDFTGHFVNPVEAEVSVNMDVKDFIVNLVVDCTSVSLIAVLH